MVYALNSKLSVNRRESSSLSICTMNIVVAFNRNYADEFNVDSLTVISEDEFEKFKILCKNYLSPIEIFFGTNESLDFSNGVDLLSAFRVLPFEGNAVVQIGRAASLSGVDSVADHVIAFVTEHADD